EALFRLGWLTAEGPFLARRLRALGASDVCLLPLALPEWCLEEPRVRLNAPGFRLLQVCRLVPKQGVDVTIKAVARSRALGLQARLEIIGEGPERQSLEMLSAALRARDFVSFHGAKPYSELRDAFARADALVQPSRTTPDGDTEGGHPAVVLE